MQYIIEKQKTTVQRALIEIHKTSQICSLNNDTIRESFRPGTKISLNFILGIR